MSQKPTRKYHVWRAAQCRYFADADNFEPPKPVVADNIVGGAKLNKWEGEDEEENIKVPVASCYYNYSYNCSSACPSLIENTLESGCLRLGSIVR